MNNGKWTWFAIGYQTILAYAVSLCVYQVGTSVIERTLGIGTAVAAALIALFIYLLLRPYKESRSLKLDGKAGTIV